MDKFSKIEFSLKKRDPILDYAIYSFNFDEMTNTFDAVRSSLSKADADPAMFEPYNVMAATQQRAWDSLAYILNLYSAGHPVAEIRDVYPAIIEFWIEYLRRWNYFIEIDESADKTVAALPLLDTDFSFANQLVCLGILLGWGGILRNLIDLIDLNNFRKDGMLERLLAPYTYERDMPPNECTRHLPYFKTLKIFAATTEERSILMSDYLKEWYHASRREPYYDSHKHGDSFTGYWSWEAAAITYLLDIDDSIYRDSKFYPTDLVEFARNIQAPRSNVTNSESYHGLRCKSGQPCPKNGIWETLDIPMQRRKFSAGEIMQAESASYGITVWRYIGI